MRYETFWVSYYESGKRIRKGFSDKVLAQKHAESALTRLVNGITAGETMHPVEIQAAGLAQKEAAKLGLDVLTIVKEYRTALDLLGSSGSLLDAVRYFTTNASPTLPNKKPDEIVTEMVKAKRQDKLAEKYIKDLDHRCTKFAGAFKKPILEVRMADIEAWLRGLGTGAKNRNNYANAITTLFRFAKRAGYLPHDRNTAADELTRAKHTGGTIHIYAPQELANILARLKMFKPEFLPFVALGAFTGIRTAELERLTWDQIDFEQKLVEVSAKNAKTAQRRHVPLQPNLLLWLKPYRKAEGAICPSTETQLLVRRFLSKEFKPSKGATQPGIKWKPNALRHSYGSYRLPIIKSAAELALEMGNSPAMIFRHYRELVKPKQAEEYWSISPAKE